jgi:ribosomal protein S28E/S33
MAQGSSGGVMMILCFMQQEEDKVTGREAEGPVREEKQFPITGL